MLFLNRHGRGDGMQCALQWMLSNATGPFVQPLSSDGSQADMPYFKCVIASIVFGIVHGFGLAAQASPLGAYCIWRVERHTACTNLDFGATHVECMLLFLSSWLHELP